MPVTKEAGGPTTITPAKALNTLDGQVSGATRDADWSITEQHDPSIQLQADLGAAEPGAIIVLKAPEGATGTIELTLPDASGTVTTGGGGGTIPPESSVDNSVARFNGVAGDEIQDSLTIIDDVGSISTGNGAAPPSFSPVGLAISMADNDVGVSMRGEGEDNTVELVTSVYGGLVAPGGFIGTVTSHDLVLYASNTNMMTLRSDTSGVDIAGDLEATGDVAAATVTPANGASGTLVDDGGQTITVVNGIITSITGP